MEATPRGNQHKELGGEDVCHTGAPQKKGSKSYFYLMETMHC